MPRFISASCPTITGIRDLQESPFMHYVYIALEVGPCTKAAVGRHNGLTRSHRRI